MFNPNSIKDLQFSGEKQILDRKSARIAPRDFSVSVCAMANADGGYLIIGIEDDGTITGIDEYEKNVNDLQRVPFDFCVPSVQTENDVLEVIDCRGRKNHILRMHVFPSLMFQPGGRGVSESRRQMPQNEFRTETAIVLC